MNHESNVKIDKADEDFQKIISRKRNYDADDRKVANEIFDNRTLKSLYKLANQGYIDVLNGAISTGKEANVLKGFRDDNSIVAVKIYRVATSDFKKMQYYIAGDPRFNIRTNNKSQLIGSWVNKEFRNLNRLYEAGVNVPKPFVNLNNVLVMEFVGDENGKPYPTVKYLPPKDPNDFYYQLVDQLDKFINDANLIHGDLSTYNIINYNEKPVIIDVSQSVVKDHIIAKELLKRDIKNLVKEFSKMGVDTSIEDLTNRILH